MRSTLSPSVCEVFNVLHLNRFYFSFLLLSFLKRGGGVGGGGRGEA